MIYMEYKVISSYIVILFKFQKGLFGIFDQMKNIYLVARINKKKSILIRKRIAKLMFNYKLSNFQDLVCEEMTGNVWTFAKITTNSVLLINTSIIFYIINQTRHK